MATVLLIAMIGYSESPAQTRFFERGDSGGAGAFSAGWRNLSTAEIGILSASYTYKGLFDIGMGRGGKGTRSYDPSGFVFGRAVILDPGSPTGLG